MKPRYRTHPFPEPERAATKTLVGYLPPLHLPGPTRTAHTEALLDTIVVDIEIAPDGQAYIERLP